MTRTLGGSERVRPTGRPEGKHPSAKHENRPTERGGTFRLGEFAEDAQRRLVDGLPSAEPAGDQHRAGATRDAIDPDERIAGERDVEDVLRERPADRRRAGGAEKSGEGTQQHELRSLRRLQLTL